MDVLIAEDHLLTANLLANLLSKNENFNVIGIVSDGLKLIEVASKKKIDVCLLDISMPNMDGLQALSKLARKRKRTKFLILSAHTESWIIEKAMKLGASGYITKRADIEEVIYAIQMIYSGLQYFDSTASASINNGLKENSLKVC